MDVSTLFIGACVMFCMQHAQATSIKMDYFPLAHVRTDPVLHTSCLSGHVHTFYGVNASLRPETSYEDMRQAKGNSGNVKENKSLYWHPTIYMYEYKPIVTYLLLTTN